MTSSFNRHWPVFAVLLLMGGAGAVGLAAWFQPWAPGVVRRLPAGDTLVFVDMEPLRAAGLLSPAAKVAATAPNASAGAEEGGGYKNFVRASGFDFERDLDALACSLQGAPLQPATTTCVLRGRWQPHFQDYLRTHARRRLGLDGLEAFAFPGWARPQQTLWVVELDAHHLMLSNAQMDAELVQRARSRWHRASALWQAPVWAPVPIAYLGMNTLQLAAEQEIDGRRPPWAGTKQLQARLTAQPTAWLVLQGQEHMRSAADAAAARAWAEGRMAKLIAMLPEGNGTTLSWRGVLERLELGQKGLDVNFRLRLDPAALRALKSAKY